MITSTQLTLIDSRSKSTAESFVKHINDAMDKFNIKTPKQQAMFLAQCAVESAGFTTLSENLNYSSADRIRIVFKPHFAPTVGKPNAQDFTRNPEKLANHVYANRGGNGNSESGDGFKFRGGGLFQLTFRNNWQACAKDSNIPLDELLKIARNEVGACLTAAWFWSSNNLNRFADKDDIDGCSKAINGAGARQESLNERRKVWERTKSVLGV